MNKNPPVIYHPEHSYTFEQFEELNDWLKTNELVIDEEPINHFELDSKGRLIPMPQTPYGKELAVEEIARQLGNWNIQTRQNGGVTTSQGGFNISTTGGRTIRAPDIAFTPRGTHDSLDAEQLRTFQGQPFHPTFVVEVEDVSAGPKLEKLTDKFKTEYFPAGVQLGWLLDPENKNIYVFKKNARGVARRQNIGWRDVAGGDVLPGFVLKVWKIDQAISQLPSESSSGASDSEEVEEIDCPKCGSTFESYYSFIKHFEDEHARKKRKVH